ncbi:MAG: leucine-rich repeat domain-containing protein [Gammaproteobacteria bacterium]|nr:leucine-rich repeat domain-containing protein [Gammaproteobacteria bacterium]
MSFDLGTAFQRRLVALLTVALTFAGSGVAAQEGGLFQPREPIAVDPGDEDDRAPLRSTARMPTRGGDTVRHREVRVDFERLALVKRTLEAGQSASLYLNLFDDVAFRAVDLRIAPTGSGGYSLAGRLEGVLFGTATIVVSGEIVKGTVRTSSGTYTIDAVDGVCHIRLVDPSTLPPLGEPLRPPESLYRGYDGSATNLTSATADDHESVVDVLVVYTPAARDAIGGILPAIAQVELFVAEANQAFADSGVDQQIFLTRVVEVDYQESGSASLDLNRLANPSDGHMDIVHELREKSGSDLVHIIADVSGVCGIAFIMWQVSPLFERLGFGLTDHGCGGLTFAHELGHNMGLRHDRYVDSGNTPFPYSHGYVNRATFEEGAPAESRWRTIMSYPNECSDAGFVCQELLRFSNPDQEYEGDPMGIAEGDEAADARRGLNDTRHVIAGFREAGPDLTATPLITNRAWDVGQTNIILIGVVRNEGRIESGATVVKFYRSADPTITSDDVELASYSVEPLGAKDSYNPTHLETAPDAGGYYYGLCVDAVPGETDTENCSDGVYVTVGPTVSVADSQTAEGEMLSFSVSLSQARDTPVEVEWELERETAVAGLDFADVSGKVTIPANQTAATISVETFADDIPEADDTFTVTLVTTTPEPPAGVVLSFDGTRATGTILNDDGEPKFADSHLRDAVLLALNKPLDGDFTLEELASLRVLDASGTDEDKVDNLTGLEAATGLETLLLFNNAVSDLSALGHLGGLKGLFLDRNGFQDLDGLAPLKGLVDLSLTGNPLQDLSPLADLSALERLWLDETGILDIAPLAELAALQVLILRCANRYDFVGRAACEDESITDISPLTGLTNLTTLDLNFNNVVDVRPLAGLTRLNYLDLWGNEISDLTPLENLVDLFWMGLDDNEITDIRPLAGLSIIEALHLNGNAVADISPLANLEALDTLGLNGNGISDIAVLKNLERLRLLWLGENSISELSPLAGLDQLALLDLGNNGIANISVLADLIRLVEVHLQNNRIRDVSPLANLRRLSYVDLSNNDIRDIEPLASNTRLRNGDIVHIQGNPLSEAAFSVHVPALLQRDVDLTYIGVSIAAGSAVEGSEMEFVVRVAPAAEEDVIVDWAVLENSASAGDDYPMSQSDSVTVTAGETAAVFTVATTEDAQRERHEMVEVQLTEGVAFPDGVGLAGSVEEDGSGLRATALGLIVDPEGPSEDVPLFASASDETRQGFVRVINHGERNVVHIVAADDMGNRHATTLAMDPGETVHFNSNDLERGNTGKGLSRGIDEEDEEGADWRLELSGNDVAVLTYMRTNDGFLTSLHDVVPAVADGYSVPIFNPGRNTNQESLLRLINGGEADAELTITGIDDAGARSGEASLTLAAGEARTVPAGNLENGTDLDGMLGSGSGKWRLDLASDQPILVSSLMQTPTGHLTNLSTMPDNKVAAGDETTHHVYLFPSAADPDGRQGFVRVINRGEAGSVSIKAYDDTATDHQPVALALNANQTVHFNSADLEAGATGKGLPEGVGAGQGDWRLELTSMLDLDVLAYIRRTEDGFLTSMHDTVPSVDGIHRVPIFNPGSNRNQVSQLRLINSGDEAAEITISGVDDTGRASAGQVRLSLPAGKVCTVTAQALEAGADDLDGALGDGFGKWSLEVNSDMPIHVLNLLASPTGHLTNLSTRPAVETAAP